MAVGFFLKSVLLDMWLFWNSIFLVSLFKIGLMALKKENDLVNLGNQLEKSKWYIFVEDLPNYKPIYNFSYLLSFYHVGLFDQNNRF